ncbi:MAG: choice-of-anchor D domain-containing protein [Candidatus Kapaibacteriota bacterium]
MKKNSLLFLGTLLLLSIRILFAEQPKYILFDNLERKNFVDSAYWIYLTDPTFMPEIAPYVVREPFNDLTLQKYNLTDFDVAIFLLGDNKLNTKVGNASVLNAIRQMIRAGKNCLIIGRNVLYYAFNPQGGDLNPEVQKFLSDTLGIDYLTRVYVSRQSGNEITYWSFNVRGAFGDPVGQSIIKWCNIGFQAGSETWYPLAIYLAFDVFKSKDPQKFPPVDHFIRTNNAVPNDTIVGIRTEWGTARLCFWSIGFEAFAGDIPRGYQLARAMNWLKGNIAPDGAAYDIDPNIVDFGEIQPGKSDTIEVTITSTGKLDLKIEEIDFWDNPDSVFEIISGKITKPITLKRGQKYSFAVKFTPKDRIAYRGSISIKTNALNNEYYYLDVWGYGGGVEAKGPILETNFPENKIDFGKVKKPTSKIVELVLKNVGDKTLEISEFQIDTTYKDHERFDFAQVLQTPIYIEPNDSFKVKVRFSAATQEERVYYGRIKVVTNAKSNNNFFIELQGEVEGFVSVNDELSMSFNVGYNPLEKAIEVVFDDETKIKQGKILIVNSIGQLIKTYIPDSFLKGKIKLSCDQISSGTYFIIVHADNGFYVKPIAIIK